MTPPATRHSWTQIWRLIRRLWAYEIAMWRSLYRWTLRRPPVTEAGAVAFGQAKSTTPVIWVFIVLSAIEIPAVDLLLPWESARLTVAFLGVYGLVWMVGLLAMVKTHPHVVAPSGLRLRQSATVLLPVPWENVVSVSTRNRSLPTGRTFQYEQTPDGTVLSVVILSQTNVDIVLREPTVFDLPKGPTEPVTELRIWADEPKDMVAEAREHLLQASARAA
ncbi:hypothetical protein [Catellatospora sichuanensis]|uniref:hypothetical protein n=1 Tax=Catellatospora sichuanensis TaxID=1969805 RepID=UPI00118404CC|nr:hypothetical protein [Catellatospora sichuanensis]